MLSAMNWCAAVVIGLVVFAGCGGSAKGHASTSSTAPTSTSGSVSPGASLLAVREIGDPPLGAPFPAALHATYPQVSGDGLDLSRVNSALRSIFVSDERSFAHGEPGPCTTQCASAFYRSVADVTIASTSVVSVMASVEGFYPGAAHPYQHWLAVTVQVPSGRRLRLADLFQTPLGALQLIAPVVRTKLKGDPCIAQSWQGISPDAFATGINPTPQNYSNIALTPNALEIGIDQGQTAAEACGSRKVLVPWSAVRSPLTSLGTQLVAALAPPH
jgi:hypothetical protein